MKKRIRIPFLFLAILFFLSVFAFVSPYDPDAMSVTEKLHGVSSSHWLGTDDLGRDMLTRLLYGGRISLLVGFVSMTVSVVLGVAVGTISAFEGGIVDIICMRGIDVLLSVPSLLIIIVVYAFLPRNMITLILMLAFFSWMKIARIVRAQTLSLKEREFVVAAQTIGASKGRIIIKHIIPNMIPQIVVAASLSMANAILDESALSFLGYGVQLPMSSWGSMLQTAQKFILYRPMMAIAPGIMIFITVVSLHMLGDLIQNPEGEEDE